MNYEARNVARAFEDIASLLEIGGVDPYRAAAYRRGARGVLGEGDRLEELLEQDRLQSIRGIGPALAGKIREIVETGRCEYLERLAEEVPRSVLELLRIPGLGVRTTARIYQELGVSSLEELEEAAREKRLRRIRGIGARTETSILEGALKLRTHQPGLTLDWAHALAVLLREAVGSCSGVCDVFPVGELRRRAALVRCLEMIVVSEADVELDAGSLPGITAVRMPEDQDGGRWPRVDLQFDVGIAGRLHRVPPEEVGIASLLLTGSAAHLGELQTLGFDAEDAHRGVSEEEIYRCLGLDPVGPALRLGIGEVRASQKKELYPLVGMDDIRGDLHCHTTYSDGAASIEDMVVAARNLGWEYLAVTDHSASLRVAGGLDVDRLRQQGAEIRGLREKYPGFHLLRGTEVEIAGDGSLDFPDEVLEELDVVVACLHMGLDGSSERLTRRLVAAARHPSVHIIAHPTGRLLGLRQPEVPDLDLLLRVCSETGTALEINSNPDRLDLPYRWARRAREMGVLLAVNSDAHAGGDLDMIQYGVDWAQKAWCRPEHVINCWPPRRLMHWLREGTTAEEGC